MHRPKSEVRATPELPPFPATPLGSLSALKDNYLSFWPQCASFVSATSEQCVEAVRAKLDDPDPCVAYIARTVAYQVEQKPASFWFNHDVAQRCLKRYSRYLNELENSIARIDVAAQPADGLPPELAVLANASWQLLRVLGVYADVAFVFDIANLIEADRINTVNALAVRLGAALRATHGAIQSTTLLVPHAAYSIRNLCRTNIFEAIYSTGALVVERCWYAIEPLETHACPEGCGPANFDAENLAHKFWEQLAIVRDCIGYRVDIVAADLEAAINLEVERRRLSIVQPQRDPPPPAPQPRLVVNVDGEFATYDGKHYHVGSDGALLLKALLDANGGLVSASKIGVRIDKLSLAPAISALIVARPGKGCFIPRDKLWTQLRPIITVATSNLDVDS